MDYEFLFKLLRELPITIIAIVFLLFYWKVREVASKVSNIEKKMISPEDYSNTVTTVIEVKEGKRWIETCDKIHTEVDRRLALVEQHILN